MLLGYNECVKYSWVANVTSLVSGYPSSSAHNQAENQQK